MPGDPAAALFGRFQGRLKPEALDALRRAFGLSEDPVWVQYLTYLKELTQGNLGVSVAYFPAPVTEVMMSGLGWTLLLAGVSVLIAFSVGTGLGIVLAWRRGSLWDNTLPPLLALLGAFPYFWTAMALLFFSVFRQDGFLCGTLTVTIFHPHGASSFYMMCGVIWFYLLSPSFLPHWVVGC